MPAARAPLPVRFHPAVEEWFSATFPSPTLAQEKGWPPIQAGRHTLVFAPTGSGKTLAAFLAAIDRLMFAPVPEPRDRCRIVYVSPLRALAVDVERNLRAPIAGIARAAQRRGETLHVPVVGLRTGDTPAAERARMVRQPPDILVTTPESLFLVLTSQARSMLPSVEAVIVDEIHTMVGSKRGAHLAVSLERLQELARNPPQRIGLSATQRPLEEVARYLGGGEAGARSWRPRPVEIVDAGSRKALALTVEVPVEDMTRPGADAKDDGIIEGPAGAPAPRASIWPAIHPRLLELIRAHRSTLVFVNSRRLAERMAAALNELAGEDLVRAHHGSLSREQRLQVEDDLKAGRLPAMVATSSLELGIDMGAIDLVIQIEAPPSVASGLQRIGRGGHQAGAVSRGIIFPKYRGDLLAAATITRAMHEGKVEETRIPMNPLDVLAQQVVAICAGAEQTVDGLFALVRRAAPFARLPRAQLEGVLDMLSGRYPSDEFAELRPRLVWDRLRGAVRAREGAARLAVTNAGTIPDRGLYGVFLADGAASGRPGAEDGRRPGGRRVGELDEEMVFESRAGEVFVLGASSWRIVEIERDRVLVVPAPGEPGKMPLWKGDRPARPVELGRALGRLTRELAAAPPAESRRRLVEEHDLDARAAENLIAYIAEQKEATGVLPDDRTLVLERTRDEMGDWRLCLLSPWGGRVHAPWALALQSRLRATLDVDVETVWSDDGIVVRVPDREDPPTGADLVPDPGEVEDLVVRELGGSAMFAAHFREAAARALLLPRRRPGLRSPLWMQRKRAADLLAVAARYGSFPIILEAYRECLQDVFDLPALIALASGLRRREIRVMTVDTQTPSPFSASLLFGYVANYLYDGDAPLAERKAQALSVDQAQLRELLGQAELRELLDPEAIDERERTLQALDETRRARSADRVHELLLRIGDLTPDELRARAAAPAEAWTLELMRDRRIIRVRLAGDERFAAAEDAGRLRDAFGVPSPPGLPQAFLEPAPHALRDVVSRYARTHAPFTAEEVARRYAVGESAIEGALEDLSRSGRVVEGAFRPGGGGREWCDVDVLATLRRRSLARLRRQVEPVDPAALARLALSWQGITTGPQPSMRRGPDALLDVIEQIQGAAIPASALETDVMPARIPGYRAEDLDALCAAGEVVWVGLGPLGERDGRITLFLADALPLLHMPRPDPPAGDVHEALRAHLAKHGASFFAELAAAAAGTLARTVLEALWDLVWAGEVTNDTPGALRAYLRPAPSAAARRSSRAAHFRSRRQSPPSAVGRWSRLPRPAAGKGASTARAKAIAEQLLARHGVLTRPAVMAEGVAGGFAALYPVLKALEEAGRIRRGYFVAGLGGSQFALPGALERLRAVREAALDDEDVPPGAVLAATDPANAYGAAVVWPEAVSGRAMRAAGVHVALVDGLLAAVVARGDGEILPLLPEGEPARTRTARGLAGALARWALRTGRTSLGWGGAGLAAAAEHAVLADALRASGFVPWGPGFRLTSAPPPSAPGMTTPDPAEA
ncbi:MAG: DEAD/DEAH box helicase [Acidobacteria bacterium]|nr:MAG: DEAD/DEAH box helicase [Acidobacteriota bacterium]